MSLVSNSDIHIDKAESSGTYTKDVLFESISENLEQKLKNGFPWKI